MVLSKRKRFADGHENGDYDNTTPSMLKLPFDSKDYGTNYDLLRT